MHVLVLVLVHVLVLVLALQRITSGATCSICWPTSPPSSDELATLVEKRRWNR